MKRVLRTSSLLVASALMFCGCNQASEEVEVTGNGGAEESTLSAPPSSSAEEIAIAAADVKLEPVSCDEWDQALAAQQGRIVVVDTWATWCVPCREEFPSLVALHGKYADDGVICMSVSVDAPEDSDSALAFLKQHQATFANYRIQDENNAWWDKWNIRGIPIVLVFNTDGTLAKKFDKDDPDNQFTYADVEKFVAELIEKSRPAGS